LPINYALAVAARFSGLVRWNRRQLDGEEEGGAEEGLIISGRVIMGLVIGVLALPAVYILSAPLVMWLWVHNYLPVWVEDIYSPLHYVPPVLRFVIWLVNHPA
jgi:hypothetical protein